MNNNTILLGIHVMVILSFTSCFFDVEKSYTTSNEEICKCYTESNIESIDKRLDECIKPFNTFISELSNSNASIEEIEKLGKDGLLIIVDELTKKCPAYRQSFLLLSINKFGNLPKNKAQKIIAQSENEPDSKIDTLKLVDSYLTISERDKANNLLNIFISKHPNSDYALWMKSYNYYMGKKIFESVAVIDSAIRLTKSQEMKTVLGYYKNTINPLVTDKNDEITIKYIQER